MRIYGNHKNIIQEEWVEMWKSEIKRSTQKDWRKGQDIWKEKAQKGRIRGQETWKEKRISKIQKLKSYEENIGES